ncbi:MAG: hypothetical protein WCP33_01360, partial [Deltaproteobacteria bacterium]
MSKVLSIYLDGTVAQVVRVNISNSSVTLREAITLPYDELESYLQECREKACVLSYNTSLFYQDTVYLPQATAKYYDNLVRVEVQKHHSDLANFSFFFRTVGETTVEGVPNSKIVAFSYAEESLADLVSIFHNSNKVITNLYAAPYTIFRLAVAACGNDPDRARLFIAPLPSEKLVLLSEKDELEFVRKIPSPETALLPADIQNINMTMDYCFQSLRVRVSEAIMLDPSDNTEELASSFNSSFRSILPAALAGLPEDIVRDYFAPLATALHHVQSRGDCDILPATYVSFKQNKKILTAAILVQLIFMLILGWLVMKEQSLIDQHHAVTKTHRAKLGNAGEEISAYKKLDEEIKAQENPIAFLNKINMSQNPENALATLAPPVTKDFSYKGITLKRGDSAVNVHLEGTISASGYKDT